MDKDSSRFLVGVLMWILTTLIQITIGTFANYVAYSNWQHSVKNNHCLQVESVQVTK
jgi:cobalamin biosynthesis protein CobD/CbiB